MSSVIAIRSAFESIDEKHTCICVEVTGGSEKSVNTCVPWMNLQALSKDSNFFKYYTSERFSSDDMDTQWRALTLNWTLDNEKPFSMGNYAQRARVTHCEDTLGFNFSELEFTTWTNNWLQFYRPLQEKKCKNHHYDGSEL